MAEPNFPSRPSSHICSSTIGPSARQNTGLVRSRHQRIGDLQPGSRDQNNTTKSSDQGTSSQRAKPHTRVNPWPASSPDRRSDAPTIGKFLGESWSQSWSTVQGFATTILSSSESLKVQSGSGPKNVKTTSSRLNLWDTNKTRSLAHSWGPAPPIRNPGLSAVAAGSLAEREAALRAARTATILESHEGVNGGLDVAGKYKHRNSDEIAPEASRPEEFLVYIHHVQPSDTYAGIILRYKCGEDAFRRANGLWSRDTVQIRKWLAIPVDACEVRGEPCSPPLPTTDHHSATVDLISLTTAPAQPGEDADPFDKIGIKKSIDFADLVSKGIENEERSWSHVRWVHLDTISEPVEIGRMSRQTMGYFPPRRRSIRAVSSPTTPRQSSDFSDMSSAPHDYSRTSISRSLNIAQTATLGSPGTSRDQSHDPETDVLPAWMRGPGGVGSMGRNTRLPGPEKDYLNSWARKHLPSLNLGELPSMSVMGSETAQLGFKHELNGIVESPFEAGRESLPAFNQGTSLDKAAAAVETWLRSALAKRPGTPKRGNISWQGKRSTSDSGEGDLIELSHTTTEEPRTIDAVSDLIRSRTIPTTGDLRNRKVN